MKKGKRQLIENYQIIDTIQQYERQYSILLARNVTDKKYYTLKKLSLSEGGEALYDALLNQGTEGTITAKILKTVKHDNVVTCYRMFKTSSKLYIVYGYEEGNTLDQILELGPKALTFAQKENIAKQLCLALSQIQKNLVVHLNVRPQSIFLNKKMNITLKEFMYAMEVPEDGQIDIKRKIPKSQFLAPEVKRGIASQEGDVYSFGKVLEKLQFKKSKKDQGGQDNSTRLNELDTMIKGMIAKDRFQRYTLSDVYQILFSKLKKVRRLRSRSQSLGGSRLTQQSLSSSKLLSKNNKMVSQILLKILQQRNMSHILIKLFRTVTVFIKFNSEHTVIFGFMLLKKSTKMIANLGKFLRYGKNDIGIEINPKELAKFTKTTDYFKLCELLDNQIALQKKEFEKAAQTIFTHNSSLFKHQNFNLEMKNEAISQQYLAQLAREYLIQMLQQPRFLNELREELLVDLVLVSHIASENSFQEFFRANFSYDQLFLEDQPFLKRFKGMPRLLLVQEIEKNLKWSKNQGRDKQNIRDTLKSVESENPRQTQERHFLMLTQEKESQRQGQQKPALFGGQTDRSKQEGGETQRSKREAPKPESKEAQTFQLSQI